MFILLAKDTNTSTTMIPKAKLTNIYESSFSELRRLPPKSTEPTIKTD
jgi:hypothetical protein